MAKRDCSELALKITQLAMNISSREGVNTLDDVVIRMKEHVPEINRETIVDAIVEATERGPRETQETIDTINAIKREARQDKALQRKIEELERTLKAGEVPVSAKRAQRQATKAIQSLREIRDKLKKQLATSEPAQKAKLRKQITELEKRIEEGDFIPKIKPPETRKGRELEKLEFERNQLRNEIQANIRAMKPKTILEQIGTGHDISRAIMTSYDFSAVLRQGAFVAFGNPVEAAKAFGPMVEALGSRQAEARIMKEILEHPLMPLAQKAKLHISPIDGSASLSSREEPYRAAWFRHTKGKLRIITEGTAASERAYITFLNVLRMNKFAAMVNSLGVNGEVTLKEATAIATYVNTATGRGSLGKFESAATALNAFFFAPRLVASRFQMLMGLPFWGGNARTRKLIAREYTKFLTAAGLIMAFVKIGFDEDEADIEFNPRSSDFGKIRIGNTRLDPLGGLGQVTVLIGRTVTGETKSTQTGIITPLRGENVPFAGSNVWDVLSDFQRYKFSPLFGAGINLLVGKDPVNQPATLGSEVRGLITPLAAEEVYETMKEQDIPIGVAISLMTLLGMSTATYGTHYTTMTKTELQEQIDKHTHKRDGKREDGTIYRKGDPHKNQEQRIKLLREQLRKQ